jgi:flagellar protein FlaG
MSIVKNGIDLTSTNLPSEYIKKQHSESNVSLTKGIERNIAEKENITQRSIVGNNADNDNTKKPLTPEQLEMVAQQLQDFVGEMNRGLEFTVDKDSGRDVIKVIDRSSGDLVKQYPSEEVLSLVAKLSDMVGGFIDAKV